MIDRDHQLTITRQAELLSISRGPVYYLPRPVSDADWALMRRIDELHLQHPFMGARMLRDQLAREGPDGHFKFPHLWPVKFPQAGRLNYQLFGLLGSDVLSG
jgi:hypothetical protein